MKTKNGMMTKFSERLSYGLYFIGQNFYIVLVSSFLITFFTDVGIPAATLSVILLVVKVWDAINDPIFGGVIDRIRLKSGKFIPWLRVSLAAIPLTTIALFAIPSGISLTAKIIWAAVGYILWDTAYTICDVPIFGLITTMTDNQEERNSIMSFGRVCGILGVLIVSVVIPLFRTAMGGWFTSVLVISLVGVLFLLPICFTGKERVASANADKDVGLREMFRYVRSNRYMLVFFLGLIVYTSFGISNALGMYFTRYCLGNEQLYAAIMMLSMAPGIVVGMLMPAISKKVDKFLLYRATMGIAAVINAVSWFGGYTNPALFWTFTVLRAVTGGTILCLCLMFTADCAEYGNFATGIDASGTAFAFQTFSMKLGSAISSALGAFVLAMIGFVETEGAVQPAGFNGNLWLGYTIVPAVGCLLAFFILGAYKLRDKDVQVMARANRNEISREEALNQISIKV